MQESIALLVSLATLGFALGVFVLPQAARAHRCVLGVNVAVALVLFFTDASLVAWSLLSLGTSVYLVGVATPGLASASSSGWHNWFVIVVCGSTLWLLSLFLLWTMEEAFSQPVELLSVAPAILEVIGAVFDQHLWTLLLLALLALAVAWGARGEEI